MTARPHDALFRSAFETPEHAGAQLKAVLPREVVSAIDWSSLTLEPGSFVDAELGDRHCDLLFSATVGDTAALVYLLLEHQSVADPRMPMRMLVYLVRIWERWARDHVGEQLPIILPVVVTHASTGWNAPTRFHELLAPPPASIVGLAHLVPEFTIVIDDLSRTTNAQLRARALEAFPLLALWLLRDARTVDDLLANLEDWADAFVAVASAPSGIEALAKLLRYMDLVLPEQHYAQIRAKLVAITPKTIEAEMTHAQRLIDEGLTQGRTEGLTQGRTEGRTEGQRDAVLKLLGLKFGPLDASVRERVTLGDDAALDRWLERVLVATQLDAVFEP